jgi:hypothetical protein
MLEFYYSQADQPARVAKLISGKDIMRLFHIEGGPRLGELLEQVHEAQAIGEVETREQALELVRLLLAEKT